MNRQRVLALIEIICARSESTVLYEQTKQLAKQPAGALLETKRLLKSGSYETVKQRILNESEVFGRLLNSDESKAARLGVIGRTTSADSP